MSAQKITTIEIEKPNWITNKNVTILMFSISAISYLLLSAGGTTQGKGIIEKIDSPLLNIIVGILTAILMLYMVVLFVRKPFTESGYIVVSDDSIETYINYKYGESILQKTISNLKIGKISDINTDLSRRGHSVEKYLTAQLTFTSNGKEYCFNLTFDRKERLDEFYNRFQTNAIS